MNIQRARENIYETCWNKTVPLIYLLENMLWWPKFHNCTQSLKNRLSIKTTDVNFSETTKLLPQNCYTGPIRKLYISPDSTSKVQNLTQCLPLIGQDGCNYAIRLCSWRTKWRVLLWGQAGRFFRVNVHKYRSIEKEDRCQKFNMAANSSEGFPP